MVGCSYDRSIGVCTAVGLNVAGVSCCLLAGSHILSVLHAEHACPSCASMVRAHMWPSVSEVGAAIARNVLLACGHVPPFLLMLPALVLTAPACGPACFFDVRRPHGSVACMTCNGCPMFLHNYQAWGPQAARRGCHGECRVLLVQLLKPCLQPGVQQEVLADQASECWVRPSPRGTCVMDTYGSALVRTHACMPHATPSVACKCAEYAARSQCAPGKQMISERHAANSCSLPWITTTLKAFKPA